VTTLTAADRLRNHAARAGLFVDFDGTLSEIVARPELARPLPEARSELLRLAERYALVAVVSGRPSSLIRELLGIPEDGRVEVFGLYGLPEDQASEATVQLARHELEVIANAEPDAWIEDKGSSLAVHYRNAPHPEEIEARLAPSLSELARRYGLLLLPGKKVLELAPPETPGKGQVILHEVHDRGLEACLYAGDDRADLDAFTALDQLKDEGVETLKVAVRSAETPAELLDAADLAVDGPIGFLSFLRLL
jgi:trehalose 6-phosphate phosphatase